MSSAGVGLEGEQAGGARRGPAAARPSGPGWCTAVTIGWLEQPRRDLAGRGLVGLHAHRQGAQAAQQQPRLEGRELGPDIGADGAADAVDQRLASRPRRRPPCRCGRRYISTPNGPRDRRRASPAAGRPASPRNCRSCVSNAVPLGERRQRADVMRLHGPARRAFHVEERRARQGRRDGVEVAAVHIGRW